MTIGARVSRRIRSRKSSISLGWQEDLVIAVPDCNSPGGDRFGIFKYACIMMIISGVAMLVVPWMVDGLFSSVAKPPTASPVH